MNYGYIKEELSDKDLKFSSIQSKITKLGANNIDSEYFITEYTPISDQGKLHSCCANAGVDALEILMGQKGKIVQLSRLFAYYNARLYENKQKVDDGTQIRFIFDSFKRYGVAEESTWPYDISKVNVQPILEAYKEGQDNLITAYYRIDESGNDRCDAIEKAIRANMPVVFGTAVSKEYEFYKNGDDNKIWSIPASTIGRHALLITGIRYKNGNRQFYIRNSWSEKWGIQGHCWFDSSYIEWEQSSDFWVGTLMDQLII